MSEEAIDPAQRVAQFDKPDEVTAAKGTQINFWHLTHVRPVRFVLSESSARPRFEKRSREFVDPSRWSRISPGAPRSPAIAQRPQAAGGMASALRGHA